MHVDVNVTVTVRLCAVVLDQLTRLALASRGLVLLVLLFTTVATVSAELTGPEQAQFAGEAASSFLFASRHENKRDDDRVGVRLFFFIFSLGCVNAFMLAVLFFCLLSCRSTPLLACICMLHVYLRGTRTGVVTALGQIVDGLQGALDNFQVIKKLNRLHKATGLVFNRAFSGNG